MNSLETSSMNTGKETYNYIKGHGFEIRQGRTTSSTYNAIRPEDHLFELRIRHENPEMIEALLDKIKEWLQ